MAGHVILDSCHNCGERKSHLNVIGIIKDGECDEFGKKYHHIHVFVACDECREIIWKQSIFPGITKVRIEQIFNFLS